MRTAGQSSAVGKGLRQSQAPIHQASIQSPKHMVVGPTPTAFKPEASHSNMLPGVAADTCTPTQLGKQADLGRLSGPHAGCACTSGHSAHTQHATPIPKPLSRYNGGREKECYTWAHEAGH